MMFTVSPLTPNSVAFCSNYVILMTDILPADIARSSVNWVWQCGCPETGAVRSAGAHNWQVMVSAELCC
jgi:hypothetical protein